MPLIPIQSLDDPRVGAYRDLKERDLAREGGRFIAEGEQLVGRLLASCLATESVLCADRRVSEVGPLVPADVPVYVAPASVVNEVVGFKFHSGVMAVGVRPVSPSIDQVMRNRERATLVICPEVEKTDNLGSLIRIAAGFGADAMVLGERCCDPFFRQSVRVSMGSVFTLPIVRSPNLMNDLVRLRDEFGVELVASVLDEGAEPLERCERAERMGLLLGNEAQGLAAEVVALCQRKVTIPMELGTDSLNVAVAAGIFLYHFMRVIRSQP